ncbi:MAG: hypothetical protein ACR2OD_08880 [Gaiellaceae bacterium]
MSQQLHEATVGSLAKKLSDLDLTGDEAQLLAAVLSDDEAEVAGFAVGHDATDYRSQIWKSMLVSGDGNAFKARGLVDQNPDG